MKTVYEHKELLDLINEVKALKSGESLKAAVKRSVINELIHRSLRTLNDAALIYYIEKDDMKIKYFTQDEEEMDMPVFTFIKEDKYSVRDDDDISFNDSDTELII
jgi:predicted transcriptional regulator